MTVIQKQLSNMSHHMYIMKWMKRKMPAVEESVQKLIDTFRGITLFQFIKANNAK